MMDLLDLAQMENSTFQLNKQFFSLNDVISKAFDVVGHIASKKRVILECKSPSERDSTYFSSVNGDETRFLQVIINFLSNSLKFSQEGSKIIVHTKIK
jgi:signal transduction histidine kinase